MVMILSELGTPLIDLPIFDDLRGDKRLMNYEYELAQKSDFQARFGDGINPYLSFLRLKNFLSRTGREIAANPISLHPHCCGICHEVRKKSEFSLCPSPSSCINSNANPDCMHTDNAGVFPFLDIMLYMLHTGGQIMQSDFVRMSAWMRVLSRKKMKADSVANISKESYKPLQRFRELFPGRYPPMTYESFLQGSDTPHGRVNRNKCIQGLFRQKYEPLLVSVCSKIQQVMSQPSDFSRSIDDSELAVKIVNKTRGKFYKQFWNIDAPVFR